MRFQKAICGLAITGIVGGCVASSMPMAAASSSSELGSTSANISNGSRGITQKNYASDLLKRRLEARRFSALGDAAVKSQQYESAVGYYAKAISANPSMARPNPPPKDRFFITLDSATALEACEEHTKAHLSDPYALAIQGLLQYEVGTSDGVDTLSKSIALKKDLLFTRLFRFEQSRGRDGDEDSRIALELAPNDPRAHLNRAIYYCHKRQYDESKVMFEKAFAITGPWARIYYNQANLAFAAGDIDRALALYKMARPFEPNCSSYYIGPVQALSYLRRTNEALAWLDDAAKAEAMSTKDITDWRYYVYESDNNYLGMVSTFLTDKTAIPLIVVALISLSLFGLLAVSVVGIIANSPLSLRKPPLPR